MNEFRFTCISEKEKERKKGEMKGEELWIMDTKPINNKI